MLADERHAKILHEINTHGSITTAQLIETFDVSPITIRRDLTELDALGLIAKVHGGARSVRATHNPTYTQKSQTNQQAKQEIARAAARHVKDGDSVGFAAGSTCAAVAAEVADCSNLTIITNSIRVADQFQAAPHTDLFVTGGKRTPSEALVGPLTLSALSNLHFDTLFTSTHGATAEVGLTSPSVEEAAAVRALIDSAHRVIQVFDHSKWGFNALSTFAQWSDIDLVIVDSQTPASVISQLEDLVEKVEVAQ
ncbi:DeoR/GlpR family DNA-binding transcription regulator [Rothia nasimurium]|nr:DeoR/GlpR family DNA-binding transcription regulator [Rothia nasimurium]MBF0808267.1 DeoR/GlpR transcriptional regulator [Rothia nasimurium]